MTSIQSFEIKKKKKDKQKKLSPASLHYQKFLKNKVTGDDKKKTEPNSKGKKNIKITRKSPKKLFIKNKSPKNSKTKREKEDIKDINIIEKKIKDSKKVNPPLIIKEMKPGKKTVLKKPEIKKDKKPEIKKNKSPQSKKNLVKKSPKKVSRSYSKKKKSKSKSRKISIKSKKKINNKQIEILEKHINQIRTKKPTDIKKELEKDGIKVSGKSNRLLKDIYLYSKICGINIIHEK